jgi:hypothetical protein
LISEIGNTEDRERLRSQISEIPRLSENAVTSLFEFIDDNASQSLVDKLLKEVSFVGQSESSNLLGEVGETSSISDAFPNEHVSNTENLKNAINGKHFAVTGSFVYRSKDQGSRFNYELFQQYLHNLLQNSISSVAILKRQSQI